MIRHARSRLLFIAAAVFALMGFVSCAGTQKDILADLSKQVGKLERRMEAVEMRQRDMVDILAKARGAVAYVWGEYTFVDKEGHPLRHVVDDLGEVIADPQGTPMVDIKGRGPIAATNYCGTAFLVGPQGEMLTNRHIAEPWWEDDEDVPLLAAGLKPVFLRLRAFFPERSGGIPIEVLRVDERKDIALIKTVGWVPAARPLIMQTNPDKIKEGQPILLIGYPTGLDAVLARMDDAEQAAIEEQTGGCSYETSEQLSAKKQLRTTITNGFLWDVMHNILVYDARTIGGGSGGPILDWSGMVIGVNYAYLEEFQGGNYGVPIQLGERLLAGGGIAVREAGKESQELLARYKSEKEKNIPSRNTRKALP